MPSCELRHLKLWENHFTRWTNDPYTGKPDFHEELCMTAALARIAELKAKMAAAALG